MVLTAGSAINSIFYRQYVLFNTCNMMGDVKNVHVRSVLVLGGKHSFGFLNQHDTTAMLICHNLQCYVIMNHLAFQ